MWFVMMKWKRFIPLLVFLIFAGNSAAQDSAGIGAPNCLKVLKALSLEVGRLERQYNSPSAKKIVEASDKISSGEITDNSPGDFDSMLVEIENTHLPGDALAVYSSISNDFMPEISFSEAGFRILNAVQKRLENLFQILRSDKKMVSLAIFATTNLDVSRMKTALVRRQIRILSECGKKEERMRCWLAVKRMLGEIDIPKSESGNMVVQNSPYGIQILPGEILAKLKPLSENETDDDVRQYSLGAIKAVESAPPRYKEGVTQIALNELDGYNAKDRLIKSDALRLFQKADSAIGRSGKISLYTDAIKMDPRFTAAYSNRGSLLYEIGDFKHAEEDFQKALSLDPGYYTLYKYLGNCSYKMGRLEDAVKNFSEALKYEITDTLLINRGICLRKLGQTKQAASDFSAAIRFNSKSLPARINRVQCYIALKEYNEAARDYEKLIELQPQNSSYYYNLGCLYSIQKDWNKVVGIWEEGLRVNPQDENILKNLPKVKARQSAKAEEENKGEK
jgi:tetratricopeptide (TPR) repeat protein